MNNQEMTVRISHGNSLLEKKYHQILCFEKDAFSNLEAVLINRVWHYLQALPLDFKLTVTHFQANLDLLFEAYGCHERQLMGTWCIDAQTEDRYARAIAEDLVTRLLQAILKRVDPL